MMKFLRQNAWVMWICFWLGYLGFGITTWQFWVIYLPLVALVFISHKSYEEDTKVEMEDPKPVKKDLDYFR